MKLNKTGETRQIVHKSMELCEKLGFLETKLSHAKDRHCMEFTLNAV